MKIRFRNNKIRESFFNKIKENYSKTWKEIYKILNIPKYTFEMYKSGKSGIPRELFNKLLNCIDKNSRTLILNDIEQLPNNYGQIKGGKKAYIINFEKFKEGRLKAAKINKIRMVKNFSFNQKLSEDICEIVGTFIGDGFFNSYNNKLYQVEFSGDKRWDLDYYSNIIIPKIKTIISSVNPKIYFVKDNILRVVFYSKELYCFLKDFLGFVPGEKTYTISIPQYILNNKAFLRKTIRGVFDTDGGIFFDKRKGYKKPYPRIILQTVSKELYEQLDKELSKDFKIYSFFNKNRNIYGIEIYGMDQLKKWLLLIGFSNNRHLNKIKENASIA